MQVNVLDAKNHLSRLVKEALAGEDVVIARNGTPMGRLVPVTRKGRLGGWGVLKRIGRRADAAFTPAVDEQVARRLQGRR
jgi:prevent-host-death family protein